MISEELCQFKSLHTKGDVSLQLEWNT